MLCVCLSGRPHTGAGGLVLIEHIVVYLVYSRPEVMKKHIQPTCQEAQWHLPLIVAVMLLTLPSYCLVSWSKPQHGGRAESSSVGTDTLYAFQGATVMLAFSLLLSSTGEEGGKVF